MRDYQRPLLIPYHLLAQAQNYYEAAGYVPTPVPWVVSKEAYELTKPEGALSYSTLGGRLVASGEQSFYQLLREGHKLPKAQAITPCFRDEEHDETHYPYFMKLELIETTKPSEEKLQAMVALAESFFSRFLPVKSVATPEGIDIVSSEEELELGSYGFRKAGVHHWLYGTGLALPRLTQAMARENFS